MYDTANVRISVKPTIYAPNRGFTKSPKKQILAPDFWVYRLLLIKSHIPREDGEIKKMLFYY
jgi:hypothetical protein